MQFQGALIREQGVTFAIVIVRPHVLNNRMEAQRLMLTFSPAFGGVPVVLMAQDGRGVPTYFGRPDLTRFLASVPLNRIPWRSYTLNTGQRSGGGGGFSAEDRVEMVWRKATFISPEAERQGFRKDACGAWIKRSDYGDRDSQWGWEIDHITPVSKGGEDGIANLRPLHWENNCAKSDGRLVCVITNNTPQPSAF